MMQEPQEVVEETVTIEEDPGTPTSRVSVVTSEDGTTRRTETKVFLLTTATFLKYLCLHIMLLLAMQMLICLRHLTVQLRLNLLYLYIYFFQHLYFMCITSRLLGKNRPQRAVLYLTKDFSSLI